MSTSINGVDYGPLFQLLGKWWGDRGLDLSPEPDGEDKKAYYDEIEFTPAGAAENAEEQNLVCVQYRQVVRKRKNGKIFHDQIGHWMFEPSTGLLMHSLSIPRGVCVLAGGAISDEGAGQRFKVQATAGDETFGVVQSPFMVEKAKTTAFSMSLLVDGDELSYREVTSLDIYGRAFEHVDEATLQRIVYD